MEYKTTIINLPGFDIDEQIESAYTTMLEEDEEYPYLISCRNFIPNILGYEDGVQRYIKFNAARRRMYEKFNVTVYPTACGLGSIDNHYKLLYVRAKTPMMFFDNPKQVEAFDYPQFYGKPQFSRAGVHNGNLMISGTASIRGSETIHIGDLLSQIDVTVDNLNIIIERSGVINPELVYTIYVKNKEDIDIAKQRCAQHGITGELVNVDICRDNLLVEIEAHSRSFDQ